MRTRAALALVVAACAAPAPADLPVPMALARPPAAVAAHAPPAAPACLPDAAATGVSLLEGDARTIDVCFAPTACFTIDRRTRAIAPRDPPPDPPRAQVPRELLPVTQARVRAGVTEICAGARCAELQDNQASQLAGGRADLDVDHERLLVTVGGDGNGEARFFVVNPDLHWVGPLKISVAAPCADASWVEDDILVSSDDCSGGAPLGMLYDPGGRLLEPIGPGRGLDTHGATSRRRGDTLAIVAPRAYALVLIDAPTRQAVIDLVPIQAESTPDPRFDAARLPEGDWLVASSTGGVGIVDHTTTTLAHTWILPRCDASP